jgi:hypothetical protein
MDVGFLRTGVGSLLAGGGGGARANSYTFVRSRVSTFQYWQILEINPPFWKVFEAILHFCKITLNPLRLLRLDIIKICKKIMMEIGLATLLMARERRRDHLMRGKFLYALLAPPKS